MEFLSYKNSSARVRKDLLLSIVFAVLISFLFTYPVSAVTVNSARDCDSNAVIHCGALSTSELITKYNNQASVRTIFHNFGITHVDINNIGSTAVAGKVTSGGRVLVNGVEVATNAMTAGRQNMPGSQAVTANGVTFYKRPPSVSFTSSSLSAFVVMKSGQFDFAILASCGNPVNATAVVHKTAPQPTPPAPTPKTPAPTPPPAPMQSQSQSQQQTVIVAGTTPTPTPPPPTPPAPQPQPAQIPNTGVSDIAGFGSFIALSGSAAHLLYRRFRSVSN